MKVLCILYDDPTDGMPDKYSIDELPKVDKYPDGTTVPSPKAIDFKPGELLGCVSGKYIFGQKLICTLNTLFDPENLISITIRPESFNLWLKVIFDSNSIFNTYIPLTFSNIIVSGIGILKSLNITEDILDWPFFNPVIKLDFLTISW